MTVSSTSRKIKYEGNGITTTFNYDFKIISATELKLLKTDVDGVETIITSNYTYTGLGNDNGGTVTYPEDTEIDDILVAGEVLTIYRETTQTQEYFDIQHQASFNGVNVEAAIDRLTMKCQELQEQINRCYKVGINFNDPSEIVIGLANPMTSLGDLIVGDALGNGTRLGIGVEGQVLKTSSLGTPEWGENTVWTVTDPTTSDGDMVVRNNGVLSRLGKGASTQFLTGKATAPYVQWSTIDIFKKTLLAQFYRPDYFPYSWSSKLPIMGLCCNATNFHRGWDYSAKDIYLYGYSNSYGNNYSNSYVSPIQQKLLGSVENGDSNLYMYKFKPIVFGTGESRFTNSFSENNSLIVYDEGVTIESGGGLYTNRPALCASSDSLYFGETLGTDIYCVEDLDTTYEIFGKQANFNNKNFYISFWLWKDDLEAGDCYILEKYFSSGNFLKIYINSSGNILFSVKKGGVTTTLTSVLKVNEEKVLTSFTSVLPKNYIFFYNHTDNLLNLHINGELDSSVTMDLSSFFIDQTTYPTVLFADHSHANYLKNATFSHLIINSFKELELGAEPTKIFEKDIVTYLNSCKVLTYYTNYGTPYLVNFQTTLESSKDDRYLEFVYKDLVLEANVPYVVNDTMTCMIMYNVETNNWNFYIWNQFDNNGSVYAPPNYITASRDGYVLPFIYDYSYDNQIGAEEVPYFKYLGTQTVEISEGVFVITTAMELRTSINLDLSGFTFSFCWDNVNNTNNRRKDSVDVIDNILTRFRETGDNTSFGLLNLCLDTKSFIEREYNKGNIIQGSSDPLCFAFKDTYRLYYNSKI